ncbi:xanthine dehydrogenase accessory protein XdhC [Aliisedimentitalea scapharcae]|uniref:Xanthine dehydrogenase accessory protein XdhC n=1 Tax=Aliisedimentitalea scapharcae TaxID=1524259 RepID=A0ABZ2XPM6_9RHOB
MGFDLSDLQTAVAEHGQVTRVVIADIRGSSPREVGAAMLVWDSGQSGTIGGGALEFEAAETARRQTQPTVLSRHALGPDLGQCCGGAVVLLSEIYDVTRVAALDQEVIVRPTTTGTTDIPLSVQRLLNVARGSGLPPEPQLVDGWMVEPVHKPNRPVWVWGAGHVGRAVVDVLAPMPDLSVTWIDTGPERFPDKIPAGVTSLPAVQPAALMRHAPENAEHLILTYSHALDLELCHQALLRGFSFAGVIGSKTKWARFRSRLAALGHCPMTVDTLTCPIGDPSLGKHPQQIAIGVAAQMLRPALHVQMKKESHA